MKNLLLRLSLLIATALPAMAYRDLETGTFLTRDPAGTELMDPADVLVVNGQKFEAKPSEMSDPMTLAAIMNSRDSSPSPTKSAKDEKRSQYASVMQAQYGASGESCTSVMHAVKPAQPNLYTYVNQNPWTMFDPLGLDAEPAGNGNYRFFVNPSNFGVNSFKDVQGIVKGQFVANPNPNFTGQCAVGAQYLTGTKVNGQMHDSPPTKLNGQYNWTKGAEMTPQTKEGTMVAWGWDANGNYPSKATGNHTAIYAGTNKNGDMLVTEQNFGGTGAPNGEYRTRPVFKGEVFHEVNSKQKYDKQVTDSSVQKHK